jgi:CubicO group peptidase (beta-lactamase class C family)
MHRVLLTAGSAAAAALLAGSSLSAQTLDFERMEAVADSAARAHVESGVVPGMTVVVAKDGETVFARGYGRANVEMRVAAGPQTIYGLGSITKQITAAAVMHLVDTGRLALDDNPTRFRFQGDHTFIPTAADDYRYVFSVVSDRAESVTLHQGGRQMSGKRKQ